MIDGRQYRIGFKSKQQAPLFMLWCEDWHGGEIMHASVLINSRDWIGI
jgi:hypothetical protein